jgi:hypothetical protein
VKSGDITLVKAFFPLQIEHFMNARASDTNLAISPEYIVKPLSMDETLKNTLECWKQTPKWMNLKALLKLVIAHTSPRLLVSHLDRWSSVPTMTIKPLAARCNIPW